MTVLLVHCFGRGGVGRMAVSLYKLPTASKLGWGSEHPQQSGVWLGFVTERQHLVKLRALSHLTHGILRVWRARVWDRPARFLLVDLQRGVIRENR